MTGLSGCGRVADPVEISKKIFSNEPLAAVTKFISPNYQGNLDRDLVNKYSFGQFYLLQQSNKNAIVSMVMTDSAGEKINSYLYYGFDSTWKLNDMRSFQLHYIPIYKKAFEELTPATVDSVIAEAKKDPHADYRFRTRQEYDHLLKSYRFVCDTDSSLIEHFHEHEKEFEEIRGSISAKLKTKEYREGYSPGRDIDFSDSFRIPMYYLMIDRIQREGDDYFPGCLDFQIIQTGDYSVGYIWADEEKNIPKINPEGLMMIRKIKDGWYLYRTN